MITFKGFILSVIQFISAVIMLIQLLKIILNQIDMRFMLPGCAWKCCTKTIRFVLQFMPLQLS